MLAARSSAEDAITVVRASAYLAPALQERPLLSKHDLNGAANGVLTFPVINERGVLVP